MKRGVAETIAEIATLVQQGEPFHIALGNFLDGFYFQPSIGAVEGEPSFLRAQFGRAGEVYDAYLAATAEKLARDRAIPFPRWARNPERALRVPWFASEKGSLRALLIRESPPEFRCRNLFVSENALTRV